MINMFIIDFLLIMFAFYFVSRFFWGSKPHQAKSYDQLETSHSNLKTNTQRNNSSHTFNPDRSQRLNSTATHQQSESQKEGNYPFLPERENKRSRHQAQFEQDNYNRSRGDSPKEEAHAMNVWQRNTEEVIAQRLTQLRHQTLRKTSSSQRKGSDQAVRRNNRDTDWASIEETSSIYSDQKDWENDEDLFAAMNDFSDMEFNDEDSLKSVRELEVFETEVEDVIGSKRDVKKNLPSQRLHQIAKNPRAMRQAVIWSEILQPPKSLKNKN